VETLLSCALSNAVFATILALLVAVLGRVWRRPALLHSLWLLVFLKLITPPLWPVNLPWPVPADPVPVQNSTAGLNEPELRTPEPAPSQPNLSDVVVPPTETAEAVATLPDAPREPTFQPAASEPPAAPVASESPETPAVPPLSWMSIVVAVWLAGSTFWFLLAGLRLVRFHRLLRFAHPASPGLQKQADVLARRLGLARAPSVWSVPAVVSPMLWAIGTTPRLLIPESLVGRLSDQQWDTLLAHELAHLRRRDHWVRILEMLVLSLYWWHPVVWWARRELREAEEQCCDAWVVWALPGSGEAYALALVETVTFLSQAHCPLPLAASGIGHTQPLRRRLTMIMRGTTPRALSAAGLLAVLGLGAFLLPLRATWAQTDDFAAAPDEPVAVTGDDEPPLPPSPAAPPTPALAPLPATAPAGEAALALPAGSDPRPVPAAEPPRFRRQQQVVSDELLEVELLGAQLEAKRAETTEAQVLLRKAKRDLQRLQQLRERGAVGAEEIDRAQTDLEVQEARLGGKQAQVREAELRLRQAQHHLQRLPKDTEQPRSNMPLPETAAVPHAGAAPMRPGGPGATRLPGHPDMPGAAGPMTAPAGGRMMAGPGMTPTASSGRTPGASNHDQRLDRLEASVHGLLQEVKELRRQASATAEQEKLIRELVKELKSLRRSQGEDKPESRP
jgi:beta-lactamase regulating signal transducer with metallopeptidase domain